MSTTLQLGVGSKHGVAALGHVAISRPRNGRPTQCGSLGRLSNEDSVDIDDSRPQNTAALQPGDPCVAERASTLRIQTKSLTDLAEWRIHVAMDDGIRNVCVSGQFHDQRRVGSHKQSSYSIVCAVAMFNLKVNIR